MSYELEFKNSAFKEWNKLRANVQIQAKKKLKEPLDNPRMPAAKLSGINDQVVTVTVIAVGKREGGKVYKTAMKRLR